MTIRNLTEKEQESILESLNRSASVLLNFSEQYPDGSLGKESKRKREELMPIIDLVGQGTLCVIEK